MWLPLLGSSDNSRFFIICFLLILFIYLFPGCRHRLQFPLPSLILSFFPPPTPNVDTVFCQHRVQHPFLAGRQVRRDGVQSLRATVRHWDRGEDVVRPFSFLYGYGFRVLSFILIDTRIVLLFPTFNMFLPQPLRFPHHPFHPHSPFISYLPFPYFSVSSPVAPS